MYTKAGSPFWYKITFTPDSPRQTAVWCDVYASKYTSAFRFEGTVKDSLEKEMKSKIKELEETYAALEKSNDLSDESRTFVVNSPPMLSTDKSCADAQAEIAEMIKAHLKEEKILGKEIQPAAVQQCRSAAFAQAEQCKDHMPYFSSPLKPI